MGLILIIDDNAEFRTVVARQLRARNYPVIEANNTHDGLKLALERKPKLILSDVWMEGGDGLSLLTEIRRNPETALIPFILMTGQPDAEGMWKGAESAADGYLPKPFSIPTLLAAVESRLGREDSVRKQADQVKNQLQLILQASPDLIGILDPQSFRFNFLNAAGRELLKLPGALGPSTILFRDIHPEANWQLIEQEIIPTALSAGLWTGENKLVSGDQLISVKQSVQAHRGEEGQVAFLSTIAHDLSSQKAVEIALRESEAKFRFLVHSLPDGVILHDHFGRIHFSNTRASEMFSYTPEQFQERPFSSLFDAEPASAKSSALHLERTCLRSNGDSFPGSIVTSSVEISGKDIQLTIIRDLSVQKKLECERDLIELQLRQALKLESIGQLAAGIAHEINTPTQYIGDNTRFLHESFAGLARLLPAYQKLVKAARNGAVPAELLDEIAAAENEADIDYTMREIPLAIQHSLEGVGRVSSIVRAMKDFSHPGAGEKEYVDINHAIESTITVTRNEWKYVAELETAFDAALPAVPCIPGEFNQVILNLIINAAHAIADVLEEGSSEKGRIGISTRHCENAVEIRVQDSGSGIPENIRKRIFEPFFTTKEVGRGTGQGLAIARSVIVDKHGGEIDFETEVGRGTTFIIRLPLGELNSAAA